MTFNNLTLSACKYKAYLFKNNNREVVVNSSSFTINESPIISIRKDFSETDFIELSFRKGPGNNKNWIGIWGANDNPMESFSKSWLYVDGSKEGGEAKTSGVLNFGKLNPISFVSKK